jgi:glycosyltransferase involved in cell wall biosynthesis
VEYLGTEKPINKTQPMVSVCIQTYQHAAYIRQCLDSILEQQTDFPFEIVLGEDESSDGTRDICKQYAEKYPDKIRLFLRSRKDVICINGAATGRYNFMENLKASRGKFIALCEGDDYWTEPGKLQMQYDFLNSHPEYSMCVHDAMLIDNEGISLGRYGGWKSNVELLHDDFYNSILVAPTASYFFRNVLVLPKWFDRIYGADVALYFLLSKKGKVMRFPKPMSVYRKHYTGLEARYRGSAISFLRKTDVYLFYYRKTGNFKLMKKALHATYNYLDKSFKERNFKSLWQICRSYFRLLTFSAAD